MAIQHMATATAASIDQRSMAAIASPAGSRSIAPAGTERDSKSSPMRGSPQVLAVRVLRQLKDAVDTRRMEMYDEEDDED